MRVHKLSLLAVAAVAGLSLTACQGSDKGSSGASDSTTPSSQSPVSQGSGSQTSDGGGAPSSGRGTSTGSRTGSAMTSACTTSRLAFSTSGGMAGGTLIVGLRNTGSTACTLRGFPGVDLKSKDGGVSAGRSKLAAPLVKVRPGGETRFTLHYPPNNSGGSGETFTSLVVTPPNETRSHTLPVTINVPVTDGGGSAITVDPVGTGK